MILTEEKNTHMEHLEEIIFDQGSVGIRKAILTLRSLRDMLAGNSSSPINVTTKVDGAPALFAGIDPEDKQFFIAKKGLFNKTPQMFKSLEDIDQDPSLKAELKKKFRVAFQELSKLDIKKGVYQGDFLFTSADVKVETIDGEKRYTFQPNTIVYTVPVNSRLGAKVSKAKLGIVWHTTYTGSSIQTMKASFGKSIVNKMKSIPSVFMDDATYKDVSGTATFTEAETIELTNLLKQSLSSFRKINNKTLKTIQDNPDIRAKIKTYNNTFIRAGQQFPSAESHVEGLLKYLVDWYEKEIVKKKTEKGKGAWREKRDVLLTIVTENRNDLINLFELMKQLSAAKMMVVKKLNQASSLGTFIRTNKGLETTGQEGFVAVDNQGGAVKLVDRLTFSRANFSPDVIKGFQI